jgi:RNase adapter protein RapZ
VTEFLVVAGMSGAGRSSAAAALEDVGWFVIDNLPPALIASVAQVVSRTPPDVERVTLVVGRGGREQYAGIPLALDALAGEGHHVRVLFLDAPDEVLIRRFEGTRRRHPLASRGVEESIGDERRLLEVLRARADLLLDTGELNTNQLRSRVRELFGEPLESGTLRMSLMSFGYKYGIPLDVDLVFDCRFVPNPYWSEELRPQSGLDTAVSDFVIGQAEAAPFIAHVETLLVSLLPAYAREGKSYLTVAFGCTGGRHRSVALIEALGRGLGQRGVLTSAFHRDIDR